MRCSFPGSLSYVNNGNTRSISVEIANNGEDYSSNSDVVISVVPNPHLLKITPSLGLWRGGTNVEVTATGLLPFIYENDEEAKPSIECGFGEITALGSIEPYTIDGRNSDITKVQCQSPPYGGGNESALVPIFLRFLYPQGNSVILRSSGGNGAELSFQYMRDIVVTQVTSNHGSMRGGTILTLTGAFSSIAATDSIVSGYTNPLGVGTLQFKFGMTTVNATVVSESVGNLCGASL